MSKLNLDYFHGSEAEQFSFYRLPKILFTDERFSNVSSEAKFCTDFCWTEWVCR